MLDKPQIVSVNKQNSTADTVSHTVYPVEQKRKRELLSELIGKQNWPQVLVFASTRESCDELVAELNLDGIKSTWCTATRLRAAVAAPCASSPRASCGCWWPLKWPPVAWISRISSTWSTMICRSWRKTILHIGSTSRAGKSGMAISFVSREEERTLLEIEALIGQKIRRIMVPGYEVSSRDELIKQLQERRRFGKRPQREDNAAAQAMAEAKLQGQRLKRLAAAKKPRQPK